jgi:hypothetical protein
MTGGKKDKRRARSVPRRHVLVRATRREPVDTSKLARALIALVQAEAEARAQADHERELRDGDRDG